MALTRRSSIHRVTKETDIKLTLNLDGEGKSKINTGIGFFDHMLTALTFHGRIDVEIEATGDLHVDDHHMIEDVGIVLGQGLKEALGNKEKIKRYGSCYVPMDEALGFAALDISGRSYLVFQGEFKGEMVGDMSTQMVEEFFRAVSSQCGLTLHCNILYGKNDHHKIEALFKAFGRALKEAITIDESIEGVLSSKGAL